MKPILTTKAVNAIEFAVVFDINRTNKKIETGITASAPILKIAISFESNFIYQPKIMSAYGSFKRAA